MASQGKRQVFSTVTQAFLAAVRQNPEREIFHFKEGTQWVGVTWREYFESCKLVTYGLMDLGVQAKDTVAILSNTRLEWVLCDMAIFGARAISVPIYGSNTAEDCAYILRHSGAKVVFVEDTKQLDKILSIRDQVPSLKKIVVFSYSPSPQLADLKDVISMSALQELGRRALPKRGEEFEVGLAAAQPSDVFSICYTSGTTGVPKGVVLTFDSLASIIEDIEAVLGHVVYDDDVILSFLPASHIFGRVESLATYHFGWQVYFAESIDKVFLNLTEVRPTLLFAVPRIFEKAYQKIISAVDSGSSFSQKMFHLAMKKGYAYHQAIWEGRSPQMLEAIEYRVAGAIVFRKIFEKFGGRLRICIAGGAPLPRKIGEFMEILGVHVLEGYGLTETCAPVSVNPYGTARFGTVGKLLPEVQIKIASDGEILIKSRKVFREYFKDPESTAEAIDPQGWFHTGDIGEISTDGYLRITDRKKDLIITSGGKNIAPQKIENLAKTSKYVSHFMVYGDRKNYLTALIVLDREEIIRFAKEHHILFSEYSELVKNQNVIGLVQGIVDGINAHLASFETIKKFRVLANEFSVDTGELTPSLKLRRRFCSEKFRGDIEALYPQIDIEKESQI